MCGVNVLRTLKTQDYKKFLFPKCRHLDSAYFCEHFKIFARVERCQKCEIKKSKTITECYYNERIISK